MKVLGDVNGDGYDDIIGFGDTRVYFSLSNKDGTFGSPVSSIATYAYNSGGFNFFIFLFLNNLWKGWVSYDKYPRVICDVNGDGKDDIVGFGQSYVYVSLSTGSGFTSPSPKVTSFTYSASSLSFFLCSLVLF